MSRGRDDDVREARAASPPAREPDPARPTTRARLRTATLRLPRTDRRETVRGRDRTYALRGSQTAILETVGAFRVVPDADLALDREGRARAFEQDLRHLAAQGLVERHTVPLNGEPSRVTVLTPAGADLVRRQHDPGREPRQAFHAGLVKPRELAHDAQLYRLFQAEAGRLEDEGATILRVVLDYELKHDYQTFLHRADRPEDADREADLATFAADHHLPVIDDHLELPDLRIEYRTADGAFETRDLELVTEHYSRSQLAGKARAGFGLYRAAGAGRLRGGSAKTGGTPFDPHLLERL